MDPEISFIERSRAEETLSERLRAVIATQHAVATAPCDFTTVMNTVVERAREITRCGRRGHRALGVLSRLARRCVPLTAERGSAGCSVADGTIRSRSFDFDAPVAFMKRHWRSAAGGEFVPTSLC